METTHLSLLQRAKDEMGSTTWKDFFDLYSHLIDSWLRRRGLQAQDIEDVRQEVLTVVIRELPNFEHNGRTGAFRAWLRLATANRLRQFWRDSTRRKDRPDVGQFADMADQLEDPETGLVPASITIATADGYLGDIKWGGGYIPQTRFYHLHNAPFYSIGVE